MVGEWITKTVTQVRMVKASYRLIEVVRDIKDFDDGVRGKSGIVENRINNVLNELVRLGNICCLVSLVIRWCMGVMMRGNGNFDVLLLFVVLLLARRKINRNKRWLRWGREEEGSFVIWNEPFGHNWGEFWSREKTS